MTTSSSCSSDEYYMRLAYAAAQQAAIEGEVPIGAVLVTKTGRVFSASNRTVTQKDPSGHAEIIVLRKAAKLMDNHRLNQSTLYVTLEPCAMCAGAIVQARVARLVYAAPDPKRGAVDSAMNVLKHEAMNARIEVASGILADPCRQLLQSFFQQRRG